jgi:hypothetical protein
MGWVNLVQSRDKWRDVVTTVMNVWGFLKCGEIRD